MEVEIKRDMYRTEGRHVSWRIYIQYASLPVCPFSIVPYCGSTMARGAPQAFAPPLFCAASRENPRFKHSVSSCSPVRASYSVVGNTRKNRDDNNKRLVFLPKDANAKKSDSDSNGNSYDAARTALVLLVPCEDTAALQDSIDGWLQGWVFDWRGSLSSPVSFYPPCSLQFFSDKEHNIKGTNCEIGRLTIAVAGSLLFSNRVEITVSVDSVVPGEGGLLRDLVDFLRTNTNRGNSLEVLYKRRNLRLRKGAKHAKADGLYVRVATGSIGRELIRRWAESYQLGQFDARNSQPLAGCSTVVFRDDDAVDVEVRDCDGSLAAVVRVSLGRNNVVRARVDGKRRRAQTRRIVER